MNRIKNQLGHIRVTYFGWSQEQLARKFGMKRQVISEIELGKRTPSLVTALKLAKALNCQVEDIFILIE